MTPFGQRRSRTVWKHLASSMRLGRLITGKARGSEKRIQNADGVSDARTSNCRGYGKVAAVPPGSNLSDSFYLAGWSPPAVLHKAILCQAVGSLLREDDVV